MKTRAQLYRVSFSDMHFYIKTNLFLLLTSLHPYTHFAGKFTIANIGQSRRRKRIDSQIWWSWKEEDETGNSETGSKTRRRIYEDERRKRWRSKWTYTTSGKFVRMHLYCVSPFSMMGREFNTFHRMITCRIMLLPTWRKSAYKIAYPPILYLNIKPPYISNPPHVNY